MTPQQADYFLVPLLDGSHGLGQVFETDDMPGDALFCGLSLRRAGPGDTIAPLGLSEVVAFVFVRPGAFADGTWALAGFDQIPRFRGVFDIDRLRATGFSDVTPQDPAVIEAFLSACHGLYPWDSFGTLFDSLKRPDIALPQPRSTARP